jgi:cytochrome c
VKKFLLPLAVLGMLIACNSGSDSSTTTTTNDTAAVVTPPDAPPDITKDPNYEKGMAIEANSDCKTCHKLNEKLVGPAFKEIATKYAGADEAMVDSLAGKVINGGSGVWGQIPMTPHPNLSKEDAKTVVKYVLLLKD